MIKAYAIQVRSTEEMNNVLYRLRTKDLATGQVVGNYSVLGGRGYITFDREKIVSGNEWKFDVHGGKQNCAVLVNDTDKTVDVLNLDFIKLIAKGIKIFEYSNIPHE